MAKAGALEVASGLCGLEEKGITVADFLTGHLTLEDAARPRTLAEHSRVDYWLNRSLPELKAACANAGLNQAGEKGALVVKLALYKQIPSDDLFDAAAAAASSLVTTTIDFAAPPLVDDGGFEQPAAVALAGGALGGSGLKKKAKAMEAGKAPQPRGRPPKGKTWNADAGAWDDDPLYVAEPKPLKTPKAAGAEGEGEGEGEEGRAKRATPASAAKARATEPGQTPQPRGRPPKGKLWDATQAVWLDDPYYLPPPKLPKAAAVGPKRAREAGDEGEDDGAPAADADPLAPKPLALAADGTPLLSSAHKPLKLTADGVHSQPRGRPPSGKRWDAEAGAWAEDPEFVPKPKVKKPKPATIVTASVALVGADGGVDGGAPLDDGAPACESAFVVVAAAPLSAAPPKASKVNKKEALANGKHLQPRGRPPKGKAWNADAGVWVNAFGADADVADALDVHDVHDVSDVGEATAVAEVPDAPDE